MTECKYCGESIEWEKDEADEKWVPIEPNSGNRHNCSEYQNNETYSINYSATCKYCNSPIVWKTVQISNRDKTGQTVTISKWYPFDASQPNMQHRCEEQRHAWRAEQVNRTGRSESRLCGNGCGTLIYWNYDDRSNKNKKPLPYEQATNTRHICRNYEPREQRRPKV